MSCRKDLKSNVVYNIKQTGVNGAKLLGDGEDVRWRRWKILTVRCGKSDF